MQNYEVMYILKANLDEAAKKETIDSINAIFTDNGATIKEVKDLGLKDFAYAINDEKKGYYVLLKISAENVALNEFKRKAKLNPNFLRQLITVDNK